jgi:hypothetical protein
MTVTLESVVLRGVRVPGLTSDVVTGLVRMASQEVGQGNLPVHPSLSRQPAKPANPEPDDGTNDAMYGDAMYGGGCAARAGRLAGCAGSLVAPLSPITTGTRAITLPTGQWRSASLAVGRDGRLSSLQSRKPFGGRKGMQAQAAKAAGRELRARFEGL